MEHFSKNLDRGLIPKAALISVAFAFLATGPYAALFIGAGVCAVAIAFGLARFEWFLYFFAASRPVIDLIKLSSYHDEMTMLRWGVSVDGLLSAVFLVCAAGVFINRKSVVFWKVPGVKAYGAFLFVCALTLPFSLEKIIGLRTVLRLGMYLMLYVSAVNVLDTPAKNYRMFIAMGCSLIVPLVLGLRQAFLGQGVFASGGMVRISAGMSHPNAYAFYLMMMSIVLVAARLSVRSAAKKAGIVSLLIVVVISLVFTYTRSAWIVTGASAVVLFLGGPQRSLRYQSTVLGSVALAAVIILWFVGPAIWERFADIGDLRHNSIGWRIVIWVNSLEAFLQHPIKGYGLGSAIAVLAKSVGSETLPHNDYILLMLEGGVLCVAAYGAVLLALLRFWVKGYQQRSEAIGSSRAFFMVVAVMAIAMIQGVDNLFGCDVAFSYFWLFAGVAYNLFGRQGLVADTAKRKR